MHAVTFGEELGFKEICVEGDALTIIKGVTRSANTAAHTLAKEGRSYEWPKYWIKEAPNSVEDIVNKERIGFENE